MSDSDKAAERERQQKELHEEVEKVSALRWEDVLVFPVWIKGWNVGCNIVRVFVSLGLFWCVIFLGQCTMSTATGRRPVVRNLGDATHPGNLGGFAGSGINSAINGFQSGVIDPLDYSIERNGGLIPATPVDRTRIRVPTVPRSGDERLPDPPKRNQEQGQAPTN